MTKASVKEFNNLTIFHPSAAKFFSVSFLLYTYVIKYTGKVPAASNYYAQVFTCFNSVCF